MSSSRQDSDSSALTGWLIVLGMGAAIYVLGFVATMTLLVILMTPLGMLLLGFGLWSAFSRTSTTSSYRRYEEPRYYDDHDDADGDGD